MADTMMNRRATRRALMILSSLMNRLNLAAAKRTNLYFLSLAIALFTCSYFLGFWHHPRGTVPVVATDFASQAAPCDMDDLLERVSDTRLDFASHHAAADLLPDGDASDPALDFHPPPCAAEMSEYSPCEDVKRSLRFDRSMSIYKERHCPEGPGERLRCLVPAPFGYKVPFRWPESREWAWYANAPHKELVVAKRSQNWVHYEDGKLRFPGGGTQFLNGADKYIDDIGELIDLRGGSIRTAIDTGCGVASWGAYLLSRDILTMSFAPKDTHEAQVLFALERGVPAMTGIFASKRLPYPSRAFDMAHCSRCLIPWAQYDGLYMIELDRILRPGGYWILSGPPINWKRNWKGWERTEADLQEEQSLIESVAKRLCWKKLKEKGDLAIWQKPTNHIHCQKSKKVFKTPPFCQNQDPDRAWYTKMEDCLTPLPNVTDIREVAGGELAKWPERLNSVPQRISSGSIEVITAEVFRDDTELWKRRVEHYKSFDMHFAERGRYRNLLDMNSFLGGFAAALIDDPVWVMNAVLEDSYPNTLGVIYERGLIGTYQNWCEAMSTYPRTYDFIHANSVFSIYKHNCAEEDILFEMDRILRPEGGIIIRDDVDMIVKIMKMLQNMQYTASIVDHEDGPLEREKILMAKKQYWTAPNPDLDKKTQNDTKNSS